MFKKKFTKFRSLIIAPTTLESGRKCPAWQEQFPHAVLDFSERTVSTNPTGCTETPNGHLGEKKSVCFLTCPEGYDFVWDDSRQALKP